MIKTGTKYKIFCGPGMFSGQVFSSATRGLWYFSFSVVKGGYNEPSTEHNGKTETPSWFYRGNANSHLSSKTVYRACSWWCSQITSLPYVHWIFIFTTAKLLSVSFLATEASASTNNIQLACIPDRCRASFCFPLLPEAIYASRWATAVKP